MIKREEQSAEHLSTLLREATSDLHFEIEMLPLARDIATGEVSRGDYFRLLGVLWHIHDLAETELAGIDAALRGDPRGPGVSRRRSGGDAGRGRRLDRPDGTVCPGVS